MWQANALSLLKDLRTWKYLSSANVELFQLNLWGKGTWHGHRPAIKTEINGFALVVSAEPFSRKAPASFLTFTPIISDSVCIIPKDTAPVFPWSICWLFVYKEAKTIPPWEYFCGFKPWLRMPRRTAAWCCFRSVSMLKGSVHRASTNKEPHQALLRPSLPMHNLHNGFDGLAAAGFLQEICVSQAAKKYWVRRLARRTSQHTHTHTDIHRQTARERERDRQTLLS